MLADINYVTSCAAVHWSSMQYTLLLNVPEVLWLDAAHTCFFLWLSSVGLASLYSLADLMPT